ncbi:unnamed protein product [Orchesella dallaii]|uniref:Uncharacterized protein n=1 Tax=Orchesella dallaii TaxID=48710 RepID=A0ABP1PPW2_9HEXA
MSRNCVLEEKISNDWRIFHVAGEKLSVRKRRVTKSFDEYIKGQQKQPFGDSRNNKKDVNPSKFPTLPRISEVSENVSSSFSSCDESKTLTESDENEEKSQSKAEDNESWDSVSSDENDDEKKGDVPKGEDYGEQFRYAPYRSLTEILINNYYPKNTSEQGSTTIDKEEESVHLLSLDDKIPVAHALNRLEDINKVLKTGHLTTRMERIIEYKQDHPFDDGYEDEDEVSCCDWILYRLTKIYSQFSSSQWPN